ncbi:N-acetylmuramoyl-L-alanine amidase [Arcobacter sp. CECT 9188]|uniref:N-acetylmuramoyl-L-alanine amidase family protein n=1 Tax=Arcobacter sp. CECT 9188 TaxID=2044505 RepID=UPI002159FA7D|nr:N-acetylmuramoyl-L-alanine amidase [Arcobacter sp. CECT 9188]
MEEQYKEARIDFLKSSLKKDEDRKIKDLEKIINLGKKLGKDTRPDEEKLKVLTKRNVSTNKKVEVKTTTQNNKTIQNVKIQKETNKPNILYSIKSVSTSKNSIIVDFNVDITKDDIKFFELKPSPLYRNVFDIKGYFKDALATKLAIEGEETITIGQNQPDILRIVVSGKTKPNTSYNVSKRQLIIEVKSSTSKSNNTPKQNVIQQPTIVDNSLVDTTNAIRYIESNNNSINIKFNKKVTQKDIKYTHIKQNGNFEYIFDISGKYKYANPIKLTLDSIDKVITTQNTNSVRLRLINKTSAQIKYNIVNNELVIEAIATKSENKQSTSQSTTNQIQNLTPKNAKNKIIVLDAGHGGDDVGAVGPNKRYEKVVNLAVTKYLEAILKQRGYKVYLTRTTDKFIKVMDRTVLANEKNADLFISIHTNSITKEKANTTSGIETFFLSPARSERAKRVAAQENKSDIREMNESSKNVFLESLNRPRITASHKFAIDVQAGILQAARSKYKDVKDSGVREGPFWVLVGAQMPSILVELGYISHPEESKRLYEKDYQQLLANGIANGIDSYFLKNP